MATSSQIPSILLFIFLTITPLFGTTQAYTSTISREQLGIKEDQQTKLTFYYHDTLTGSNPTSVQIAKPASTTSNSPSTFGSLSMTDNPLTETADASSKLIGRAQGLYAMADQNEFANINIMNLVFQEGNYNGSTLSVLGRYPVNSGTGVNELPVVGGTGVFRFAKGYIQATTQSFDQKTGNIVVAYNVFVSHVGSTTTTIDGAPGVDGAPGTPGGIGVPSSSPTTSPKASRSSLSSLVSMGFFMIPLLYLFVV